jgi:hypothetical protein
MVFPLVWLSSFENWSLTASNCLNGDTKNIMNVIVKGTICSELPEKYDIIRFVGMDLMGANAISRAFYKIMQKNSYVRAGHSKSCRWRWCISNIGSYLDLELIIFFFYPLFLRRRHRALKRMLVTLNVFLYLARSPSWSYRLCMLEALWRSIPYGSFKAVSYCNWYSEKHRLTPSPLVSSRSTIEVLWFSQCSWSILRVSFCWMVMRWFLARRLVLNWR